MNFIQNNNHSVIFNLSIGIIYQSSVTDISNLYFNETLRTSEKKTRNFTTMNFFYEKVDHIWVTDLFAFFKLLGICTTVIIIEYYLIIWNYRITLLITILVSNRYCSTYKIVFSDYSSRKIRLFISNKYIIYCRDYWKECDLSINKGHYQVSKFSKLNENYSSRRKVG